MGSLHCLWLRPSRVALRLLDLHRQDDFPLSLLDEVADPAARTKLLHCLLNWSTRLLLVEWELVQALEIVVLG